jgi:hypothetical protein
MARILFGTTDVPSAGTRVQISNDDFKVKHIEFFARAGNTGNVFVGLSDVSATVNGCELTPEAAARPKGHVVIPIPPGGTVLLSVFYVDAATNGDDVDWFAILDG